ncbi:MAG: MFS transporter [Phycisphaerales bacterium]
MSDKRRDGDPGRGSASAGSIDALPGDSRTDGRSSRWGVLRHRHFRNVWLGALTSSIGTWMEMIGIQWQMALLTDLPAWKAAGNPSSPLMMGYLAAAQLTPTLLLGIMGGLVADRVDRKKMLLFTQLLLMLIAGGLTAASALGYLSPALLLVIAALNGITMAFNVPAWQVLTPRLVPRAELTKAITLNGIQFNLARVVGPGLGGFIMAINNSPTLLFSLNTLSFLGVIIAVIRTPASPPPPRDGSRSLGQVREAASFVFHQRGPLRVFIALVIFSVLAAPLIRMLPIFIKEVYHAQERAFGIMLATMGVGAVLGGLSLRVLPQWYPKHHFIPLSMTLSGIAVTLFAASTSMLWGGVAIFFAGAFWLWSFNSSMSAMQLLVDDRMRGRVMAVCNTAVFGASPLGSVIAGYIGHVVADRGGSPSPADAAAEVARVATQTGIGAQVGVGSLAIILTVCGLAMLIWRTPEIDGLKPGDPGFDRKPGLIKGVLAPAHRPDAAPRPSHVPRGSNPVPAAESSEIQS